MFTDAEKEPFSYSIERAALIADQLERLATQNLHQLAGQFANLEFWISEAVHAIRTIADYPARFQRLRDSQIGWIKTHGTKVSGYCPQCGGACELGPYTPPPPQRIPVEDLSAARDAVRQGSRRFLLRIYRGRFLDEVALRQAFDEIGIEIEPPDLERAPPPVAGEPSPPGDRVRRKRKRR